MKIAIIHDKLIWKGGLETRLRNYVSYFLEQGHDITIIYNKKAADVNFSEHVHLQKMRRLWFPKSLRKWHFSEQTASFLKQNKFDASLSLGRTAHQDAVLAPGNHLGYLAATEKSWRSFDDRMQIFMDKQSFKHSKVIFAASQMIKNELKSLYNVAEQKIKVLYPPLNTEHFTSKPPLEKSLLQKKYGFDAQKTSFLFVSTGHRRKGLPLLLQLFEELDKTKFELLVAGYPKIYSNLENVKYIGFQTEMNELYHATDYFILPALYEPFGQVVAEALQGQTPVIISHKVGAKEVIGLNEGIVVPSFEVSDWKYEIEHLADKNLVVAPNFAERNRLSLPYHAEIILDTLKNL
ncbi:MAG: glycosyltransferase family 4 protein [Chitinophagales bacterium]